MTFAVINPNTNKVENTISVEPVAVDGLAHGLGMRLECVEGIAVDIDDDYNPQDGKFYRDGMEVSKIPTVGEQIQAAIDAYTLELITGGII